MKSIAAIASVLSLLAAAPALAQEAKVSLKTIRRAEKSDGLTSMTEANAERVREVLVRRGIVFLPEGKEGAGVRLRLSPEPEFGE